MIEFGPEPIAAVDAGHTVERRRFTQFARDGHFYRDAARPALQLPQILPVVEDARQERIPSDLFRHLRRDRAVADENDQLGTTCPTRPLACK